MTVQGYNLIASVYSAEGYEETLDKIRTALAGAGMVAEKTLLVGHADKGEKWVSA